MARSTHRAFLRKVCDYDTVACQWSTTFVDIMAKRGDLCDDNPSLVSSEIPRSNAVEAMITKGDAISIFVAPGQLGLTVTTAASPGGPPRGARIDSIGPECQFRDKVLVGDIIVTINGKEVMTSADFSVGVERSRRLGIIRGGNANDREIRIQKEMEICNSLTVKELKNELEVVHGTSTSGFIEKSEFVRALAELRVDGVIPTTSTNKTTKTTTSSSSSSTICNINSIGSSSRWAKDERANILEASLKAQIGTGQTTNTKRERDEEHSKNGRVGGGQHLGKEGATANHNSNADTVDMDNIDIVGRKPSPKKKKQTNPDYARSGVVRDQIDNGIEGGRISRVRRTRSMNPTQKDNTTTSSTTTSRVVSLSPSASREDDLQSDREPRELTEEKIKKGNRKSKVDNDEEVVFQVKRQAQQEVIELLDDDENDCVPREHITFTQPIHARYDCIANPFASTVPTLHCPTCWCARCELPVRQCTDWAGHCTTTVVECQTRNKAARVATLQEQIDAVPFSPPPTVDSAIAKLMIDPRWLQLRHTALLWLRNCGADDPASAEDGILTALVYGCEVSTEIARQALTALCLTNDIVVLGRGLHLRPDTPISDHQPPPFGPHGPQMHEWLAKADAQEVTVGPCLSIPLSPTHESMKASNIRFQQTDQSNAWRAYFAQAQACVTARGDGAVAWKTFYNHQLMSRLSAMPEFHRNLERAWHCYFVELAQTRTPKA